MIENKRKESYKFKDTQIQEKHLENIGEIEKKVEEIDKKADELQRDNHFKESQHNDKGKDRIAHEINNINDR